MQYLLLTLKRGKKLYIYPAPERVIDDYIQKKITPLIHTLTHTQHNAIYGLVDRTVLIEIHFIC